VVFSSDGPIFTLASDNYTVQLWDGKTGAHIVTLEGHSNFFFFMVFSPDGSRLAFASHDGTIWFWDGKTGAHIATLEGHTDYISSMIFSTDGSRLASASRDKTVRFWDGKTGAHIATLEGHSKYIHSIVFSPDGSRIASAPHDIISPPGGLSALENEAGLLLWDGQTGAHIITLKGDFLPVVNMCCSADGSRIASFSYSTAVRLWDGATGTILDRPAFDYYIFHRSSPLRCPNSTFLLGRSTNSNRSGLFVLEFRDNGHFELSPFCWFPSGVDPSTFDVDTTASKIAVGCKDGRVFVIVISKVLIP